MRYLAHWLTIKTPPPQRLLDMALILAVIPHLSHLKFPMLVFLLTALIIISLKKKISLRFQNLLALFGFVSIIVSFYTDFNFSSLNTFSIFISLINALLVLAVIMQRLKSETNFYLYFSPAMLLFLSFFMHNSMLMLFYMILTLFTFLLLLLWHKMQSPLYDALKLSFSIFLFSLPVVALLFMVFPRISFDKKDYGFKEISVKRSGHNGQMHIGSSAQLVPSKRVVMEVLFKSDLPRNTPLYFRGTTLYVDNSSQYTQLPEEKKRLLPIQERPLYLGDKVVYDITLYPHQKRWLYTLDIPLQTPHKAIMYDDYTLFLKNNIDETYRYSASSYLKYKLNSTLNPNIKAAALKINPSRDSRAYANAKQLVSTNDKNTLKNLIRYFQDQNLSYTLQPGKLDTPTPIDSFLYDQKRGYCVHFSSAFNYLARAAGLPSRIVTGYLTNTDESFENYLVIRESMAHAWVEVYIRGEGWVRIESTLFASNNEQLQNLVAQHPSLLRQQLEQLNLQLMYFKYIIEHWILEYSHIKQMKILDQLLHNTKYLFNFVLSLAIFIGITFFFAVLLQRPKSNNTLEKLIQPLIKKAKKRGLEKDTHESMHHFFKRLQNHFDKETLKTVDTLYHKIRYSQTYDHQDLISLKKYINSLNTFAKK